MRFSAIRFADVLVELASSARLLSGYCVALSGGLDSVVLLRALATLRRSRALVPVRALHVDHGLQAQSSSWAASCRRFADACSIECSVVKVDATPGHGESPEAAARSARYAAFARELGDDEALLTAHQADDQLETVLLQLFRGGGLRGLAAMPRSTRFARGWHQRPLLGFERSELAAWAVREGLEWIEDPTNEHEGYDRNFLRHRVLPLVRSRWPAVARTVGRAALHVGEALEIEAEFASLDLAAVCEGRTLSIDRLERLTGPRRRAVVRAWLRESRLPLPAADTLAALLHDSATAARERVPVTRWAGAAVYRYRGRLYAVAGPRAAGLKGRCRAGEPFDLGAGQSLQWRASCGRGLSKQRIGAEVEVTGRFPGERLRAAGSPHVREVRRWLQERAVVPWERDAIPRIVVEGRLAALGDLAYADEFAAQPGEDAWELVWAGRPPLTPADFLSTADHGGGDSA